MENIPFRIGHGYDVHRLVEGRKLIMGGVEIPYEKDCWGIPTQMYCSMRFRTHCWVRWRWETSASTFRTQTLPMPEQTA